MTSIEERCFNLMTKVSLKNAIKQHFKNVLKTSPPKYLDKKTKEELYSIILEYRIDYYGYEKERITEMDFRQRFNRQKMKLIKKIIQHRFEKEWLKIVDKNEFNRDDEICDLLVELQDRIEKKHKEIVDNVGDCLELNHNILVELDKLKKSYDDKIDSVTKKYELLTNKQLAEIDTKKIKTEVQQEYENKKITFEKKECPCCYELTFNKIINCNHNLCKSCFDRLDTKTCPMCREELCELI